jgi:hypothetical protein
MNFDTGIARSLGHRAKPLRFFTVWQTADRAAGGLQPLQRRGRSHGDLWDEKTKKAANRDLLKVSKFTSKPDTFAIFESEKEFIIYKRLQACQ